MTRTFPVKRLIKAGLVSEEDYKALEDYTMRLFERGTQIAAKRGLILVDTKYEFGKDKNGVITLIDEIHTPDSSRYFYSEMATTNVRKTASLRNSSPRNSSASGLWKTVSRAAMAKKSRL